MAGLVLSESVAPAYAQQLQCQIPKASEIKVVPRAVKLVLDKSRSLRQIQTQQMGTINPYGFDQKTHTNAYAANEIRMSAQVKLGGQEWPSLKASCLWYDVVEINIDFKPKIVVAKEVYRDKCMRQAVMEHEMKHVKVDRALVNKYAQSMGQKVYDGLAQRGFSVGPIRTEEAKGVAQRMQETISQLLDLETKKFEIERAESQQAVDSLEEYQRVSGLCPEYHPLEVP